MNLKEYIFYSNLSQTQIGELLEINPSYIRAIMRGACKPSKKIMKRLERISNGLVTEETIISPPTHPEYKKIVQDKYGSTNFI